MSFNSCVNMKNIDNISKILGENEIPPSKIAKGLYLGNKENAHNKTYLKALGITHILNVARQAKCPHKGHFSYKKISLLDTDKEDILDHLDTALTFIDSGIKSGGVLVHCISGISRSAAFVAAWLIKRDHITAKKAVDCLMDKRFIVNPNEGFRKQLSLFANKIISR